MNCPKCGNPLQPGVTSCQICGTNIEETNGGQAQATTTVAPAPTAPVEQVSVPVQATQPEATTVAPTTIAPAPEPVSAPITQTVEQTTTETAAPAQNVVTVENVATPAAPTPTAPAEASTIAPVVNATTSSPIPSIPASINAPTVQAPEVTTLTEAKPKKKKTSLAIIVIALVLVLGGMGVYMFTSGGMSLGGAKASKNLATDIAKGTEVSSNGYKFQLQEGWVMNEDNNNNVVISNTDETVAIKLDHNNSKLDTINKDMIKAYLDLYPDYTDTAIDSTKIAAKDAYLVNTNLNQLPIQIYFIDGGNNITLGATVVYQSNESKTKNESVVTELVGTISYAESSYKALDTITKYSDAFSAFNGIYKNNGQKNPETPATPETPDVQGETQTTQTPESTDTTQGEVQNQTEESTNQTGTTPQQENQVQTTE